MSSIKQKLDLVKMQFVGYTTSVVIVTGGMSVFAIIPGQDLAAVIIVRFN